MPFNGTGTYTPAAAPNFPAVAGQPISSTYYNAVINDLATAMSNMITRDGQGKPSAAINWNGQNLTNVGTFAVTGNSTFGGTLTVTGDTTLTHLNVNTGIVLTSNNAGYYWKDASGSNPLFICDASNLVLYGTDVAGANIALFAIAMRTNTPVFNFAVSVTGPTAAPGDNSIKLATTAFMQAALTGLLTNTALLGVPTAPTAAVGVANGQLATTQFVENARAARIQTVASAATVAPLVAQDQVNITALAAACQLLNPVGVAIDGWGIVVRIKDNGTARALTYDTQYRAIGVVLPTSTVINKTLYLGMIYNAADTKWDVVSVAQEA